MSLAIEALAKVGLERETQVGAARLDPRNAVAFHDRLEAATNSLDFG